MRSHGLRISTLNFFPPFDSRSVIDFSSRPLLADVYTRVVLFLSFFFPLLERNHCLMKNAAMQMRERECMQFVFWNASPVNRETVCSDLDVTVARSSVRAKKRKTTVRRDVITSNSDRIDEKLSLRQFNDAWRARNLSEASDLSERVELVVPDTHLIVPR